MGLFTIDVKTGEAKTILKSTDWLNHLEFSPTDPTLLMFCHEGPWHKVDRIWTIRTDGSQITKVHTRTMFMEIAGHEFWSAEGKELFFISLERALMASQVSTGARFEFSTPKSLFQTRVTTASVPAISPDGKRFLMPAILNATSDTPIHVVTNWRAGVKP